MNKSEHTPGPWEAQHNDAHRSWYVVSSSGDGVTGWSRVCQSEADARLIAAAPNLLAACRGLLTFAVPLDSEAVEHVYAARRAIEMATANH